MSNGIYGKSYNKMFVDDVRSVFPGHAPNPAPAELLNLTIKTIDAWYTENLALVGQGAAHPSMLPLDIPNECFDKKQNGQLVSLVDKYMVEIKRIVLTQKLVKLAMREEDTPELIKTARQIEQQIAQNTKYNEYLSAQAQQSIGQTATEMMKRQEAMMRQIKYAEDAMMRQAAQQTTPPWNNPPWK